MRKTRDAVCRHPARRGFVAFFFVLLISAISTLPTKTTAGGTETGSVIFIHPDGSGVGAWTALRLLDQGPDGMTNWDRLEAMGVYRGHLKNSLVSSSHGGATTHAYGTKANFEHYGTNDRNPVSSLSGKTHSIMIEARDAGLPIGILNSGHLAEPGTGVFVSSAESRSMTDEITEKVIRSGADVIMGGGETLLLPESVEGRHGKPGARKDGKNLIQTAMQLGYTVVYTRDELLSVPDDTKKLLGVFAAGHTFNAKPEEALREQNLPLYNEQSPNVAEMTEVALRILSRKGMNFLLVVEEEGTDNFANSNNASGTLEALRRADAAIGVALDYIDKNPTTLLITAADSDAGGMKIVRHLESAEADHPIPKQLSNGSPLDGTDGAESSPFVSAPDRFGNRMLFVISWAGYDDLGGGIIARAHGLNADRLPRNVDNTDIYRMMYLTLFGKWLP